MKKLFLLVSLLIVQIETHALADNVRRWGPATLLQDRGVWAMHLYGNREEMARQHAQLILPMLDSTVLPFYMNKIQRNIDLNQSGLLGMLSKFVVNQIFERAYSLDIPEEDLKVYKAFADEAKIPLKKYLRAITFPDIGEYLLSNLVGKNLTVGGFGCTTIITLPEKSKDGLVHARNLDFYGLGTWEPNTVIIYYHTDSGLAYGTITSLGLNVAAPTSFNEAGLVLDLHQNTVNQVSLGGTPIIPIAEKIIRSAKTINEAVALLRGYKFTTPWKINLSSGSEGKAVTVEVSADHFAIHEAKNGRLLQTNHVDTPEMEADQFAQDYRYMADSKIRIKNIEAYLSPKNKTQVQDVLDAISSRETFAEDIETDSSLGMVSRMDNIQSVIFVHRDRLVYIAMPDFPYAIPTSGKYIPFPMNFETDGDGTNRSQLAQMPKAISNSRPRPIAVVQAQAHYRVADMSATEEGDLDKAIDHFRKAMELDHSNPTYPFMAALHIFKRSGQIYSSYEENRVDRANFLLDKGFQILSRLDTVKLSPHLQNLVWLFEGRYYDIKGWRDLAKSYYSKINRGIWEPLKDAVDKNLDDAYKFKNLKDLIIDPINSDVIQY